MNANGRECRGSFSVNRSIRGRLPRAGIIDGPLTGLCTGALACPLLSQLDRDSRY